MQGIQQRRMKDLAEEIGRNPGEYRVPEAKQRKFQRGGSDSP